MKDDDELQPLIDAYEVRAVAWDFEADQAEAYAIEFRRQAAVCRQLAQEIRDSQT